MSMMCEKTEVNESPPSLDDKFAPGGGASNLVCFGFVEGRLCVLSIKKAKVKKPIRYLPGGRKEVICKRIETPEETIIREAFEETGFRFSKEALCFISKLPKHIKGDHFHQHFFFTLVDIALSYDKTKVNQEEIVDSLWLDVEDVLQENEGRLNWHHVREVAIAFKHLWDTPMYELSLVTQAFRRQLQEGKLTPHGSRTLNHLSKEIQHILDECEKEIANLRE